MSPNKDPGQVITDIQHRLGALVLLKEEINRIEGLIAQMQCDTQAQAIAALGAEMGQMALTFADGTFDIARVRENSARIVEPLLGRHQGGGNAVGVVDEGEPEQPINPTRPCPVPNDPGKFQIYGVAIDKLHEDKISEVIAKARHNAERRVGTIAEYDGTFGKHAWRKSLYRAAYEYFCDEFGLDVIEPALSSGGADVRQPQRPHGIHSSAPAKAAEQPLPIVGTAPAFERPYDNEQPGFDMGPPIDYGPFESDVLLDPGSLPEFQEPPDDDTELDDIFGGAMLGGSIYQPKVAHTTLSPEVAIQTSPSDYRPPGGTVRHGIGVNVGIKDNPELSRALRLAQAANAGVG